MSSEWRDLRWGNLVSPEYGKALRGHDIGKGPCRVFGKNGQIGWHSEVLSSHPGVIK